MEPKNTEPTSAPNEGASDESLDIAIVGMAGRFPGAKNIDEFWTNLVSGKESIRVLTDEELLRAGVPRREFEHPDYVRACPVLEDIDKFDAAFFGLSPRDASVMDPAHRFFLEVAWEALEHSGNTGLPQEGRVGVWAGSGAPLYWMNNVRTHREIMESMGEFLVRHTGNDMNFLATRASYDLDLRGPSVNVQTACSSALVAAHMARQSLLARECDMALIGGSTIVVPMGHGYHYKEGEILSPDGHCRPFDHRSAGTVFGSGTACLVLKRLTDALDHGDTIYAVIKGSAINNDGSVKVGYLAPGVEGQVDAIREALKASRLSARDIGYVEAHGTGTSVGDPIELTALDQAFSEQTSDKQFCGVGSVKSNIGHLGEAAAGASLIKVALALKNKKIPPSLGYEKPNPRFPLEESPFFVNASLREWDGDGRPLRAGITALGAGGTNCHLILEEPPPPLPGEGGRARQLLTLSAKSKGSLERMTQNLASFLERTPDADLGDVAYTLAMGRRALPHRRVLAVESAADAVALLRGSAPTRVATASADPNDPEVVYTFPGGGAQYARMCLDLYESEPVYRSALDECFALIDTLDPGIRPLLFAAPGEAEVATKKLQRPSQALPTLFSVEYALAKLFESYGLTPAAYVGHSMGEYVAACLAGVFSVADGIRLVHTRGRLFETTQRGKMVGVSLPEADTRALMPAGLSIAAVNAPALCVASGPSELIESFSKLLAEKEIDFTPIHIDVAAHSSLLDPILSEFRAFCRTIQFRAPQKPLASNLTGRWLSAAEATDPEYWVQHLRGTVRFADCIETVLEGGPRVFLEIGPGRTLTTLVQAQKTKVKGAVNSVRHIKEPANDLDYALLTLGKVWAAGAPVDWTALYDGELRNRIALPTYSFEAQSYWVEPKRTAFEDATEPVKRENMDEWFQTVVWEPAPLVAQGAAEPLSRWLVIGRDRDGAERLAAELVKLSPDAEVVLASPGAKLRRVSESVFEVSTESATGFGDLLELLKNDGRAPEHVVLLQTRASSEDETPGERAWWSKLVPAKSSDAQASQSPSEALEVSFFEPVHLGQALGSALDKVRYSIVTERAFSVRGERVEPSARLALGAAQVIPRELPDIETRLVDLAPEGGARRQASFAQLARELTSESGEGVVVLRAPGRFSRRQRPIALPPAGAGTAPCQDGDVVLITGGLGGIGLVLAQHLARASKVRLALLSREGLPPQGEWDLLLEGRDTLPGVVRRIRQVRELERLGAQVLPVRGDVTDEASLATALAEVHTKLGSIDVLIHAAGVIADEPLQTKTDDKMRRVLGAKVLGTQNLDRLIDYEVRTFVVMSSVASLLGLPGQVDYTAANAFLDAFAEERQSRAGGRTLAINWNAWRDVGMIVDVEKPAALEPLPSGKCKHPWLDAVQDAAGGRRYFTDFSVATHWLLSEHQIEGADALIPGTGFVELARAAAEDAFASRGQSVGALELSQVTFLRPFQVGPTETRRMQIDVSWNEQGVSVTLSTAGTEEAHMTAEVRLASSAASTVDLAALRGRTPKSGKTRDGYLDQDFVRFGPRWQNLEQVRFGTEEAVLELALRAPFHADLGVFPYHPAVLDMATGAAQALIPGFRADADFFVPFGYDRVRVSSPVTGKATSHVRLRPETSSGVAAFDVRVYDESGKELIAVDGFTMKRVDASAAITQRSSERGASQAARANPAMEALLREAITPEEGVVAFERALGQEAATQVIASSVDVNVWLKKLERDARRLASDDDAGAGPSFSRPEVSTDYVEPQGFLEEQLASIWSKLLGVSGVGAVDDFFELGGNSLLAVRFFARVKKDFSISLPLSTLFQAPTVRALAEALRDQGYEEPVASVDAAPAESGAPLATPSESAPPVSGARAKKVPPPLLIRPGSGKLPLFFVHDGLGEVLLYRSLALRLDPGHAVYGLEPETQGGRFLHTRIADMARAKVERIRSVQPRGPYLLAGLCAGGVVAFEIARQLEDAGEQTLFVGLIDAADVDAEEITLRVTQDRLARIRRTFQPAEGESLVTHLGKALPVLAQKTKNFVTYELSTRIERAKNAKKVEELRKSEAASGDAPDIDFLKLYELAHREHEVHGVFQCGDVVLFRATEGDGTVGDVPFREIYADPLLGWGTRAARGVEAIDVPGGHSSALQEPHVATLARELQRTIDAATAKAGSGDTSTAFQTQTAPVGQAAHS